MYNVTHHLCENGNSGRVHWCGVSSPKQSGLNSSSSPFFPRGSQNDGPSQETTPENVSRPGIYEEKLTISIPVCGTVFLACFEQNSAFLLWTSPYDGRVVQPSSRQHRFPWPWHRAAVCRESRKARLIPNTTIPCFVCFEQNTAFLLLSLPYDGRIEQPSSWQIRCPCQRCPTIVKVDCRNIMVWKIPSRTHIPVINRCWSPARVGTASGRREGQHNALRKPID